MAERLFAQEAGAGKKPIVFLHGFGATHFAWSPMVGHFSQSHHVLAYDLPGHGGSLDYPGAGPVKVGVAAVLGDLEARGLESFHLVGHSMGGAIAALMALRVPDKVLSLTLLAPGGFGTEINTRLLHRYAAARTAGEITACLEAMTGFATPIHDTTVQSFVAMRKTPGQSEMLAAIANALFTGGRQGAIGRDTLAELQMPVKVLWGTQDRVLPTRQAHRLPGHFAGHVFEETGHMLPDEIPEAVTKLIAENVR
jgi:pyruvate dehydrogenase E2 component (dihydrolipoamide acetyltransferase)